MQRVVAFSPENDGRIVYFHQLIYASYNPSVASQQLPLHKGAFDIVTLEILSFSLTNSSKSDILYLVVEFLFAEPPLRFSPEVRPPEISATFLCILDYEIFYFQALHSSALAPSLEA